MSCRLSKMTAYNPYDAPVVKRQTAFLARGLRYAITRAPDAGSYLWSEVYGCLRARWGPLSGRDPLGTSPQDRGNLSLVPFYVSVLAVLR